jgi:hypothetical protein
MIKYLISAVVIGVIVFGTAYFGFYNTPEEAGPPTTQAE